jgi:hypothetical protein
MDAPSLPDSRYFLIERQRALPPDIEAEDESADHPAPWMKSWCPAGAEICGAALIFERLAFDSQQTPRSRMAQSVSCNADVRPAPSDGQVRYVDFMALRTTYMA